MCTIKKILTTCKNISEPREICKLQLSKGLCRALIPRWWYDAGSEKCIPFNFGGCDGNENNFPSEKACLSTCSGEFFSICFHVINNPPFSIKMKAL